MSENKPQPQTLVCRTPLPSGVKYPPELLAKDYLEFPVVGYEADGKIVKLRFNPASVGPADAIKLTGCKTSSFELFTQNGTSEVKAAGSFVFTAKLESFHLSGSPGLLVVELGLRTA